MTNRRLVCTLLIYSYVLLHLSVTPTHTRLLTSDMFLQRHHNTQCSQPEVSLTLHSKLACAAACRLHLCDVMCGRKLTGGLWLCVLCKSPTTFMAPDASQTDYMVYLINSQTGELYHYSFIKYYADKYHGVFHTNQAFCVCVYVEMYGGNNEWQAIHTDSYSTCTLVFLMCLKVVNLTSFMSLLYNLWTLAHEYVLT